MKDGMIKRILKSMAVTALAFAVLLGGYKHFNTSAIRNIGDNHITYTQK